jgi:hypothetical protein
MDEPLSSDKAGDAQARRMPLVSQAPAARDHRHEVGLAVRGTASIAHAVRKGATVQAMLARSRAPVVNFAAHSS